MPHHEREPYESPKMLEKHPVAQSIGESKALNRSFRAVRTE